MSLCSGLVTEYHTEYHIEYHRHNLKALIWLAQCLVDQKKKKKEYYLVPSPVLFLFVSK